MTLTNFDYVKDLQFKWDVYLLTCWYTKPHYRMYRVVDEFMKREKLDVEQFSSLKRTANCFRARGMRVQPFVCMNLPKIGNKLWESDLSDVFDICFSLKDSKIDAVNHGGMIDKADLKEKAKTRKLAKQNRAANTLFGMVYASHKASNQWHVTK